MDHQEESSGTPARTPARIVIGDLRYSVIVLVAIGAAFGWASWTGRFLGAVLLGFTICAVVVTGLLVLALVTLSSRRPVAQFLRRAAVQGIIIGLLTIPLLFAGAWVQGLSIRTSQRRGDRIAEALETHRLKHGHYPMSLGDLGDHAEVSIPRPTTSDEFGYDIRNGGTGFNLTFRDRNFFIPTTWTRDSESTPWSLRD